MQTTKIRIKNLFGLTDLSLDGSSVEITGAKGTGKTSVLDSIRYALTNKSDRDYIVRQGETEGEILIETDSGLAIKRKKRTDKSDFVSVKDGSKVITAPQAFLNEIFTPLQLDPIAFAQLSKNEKNRMILDLIEFDWDMKWIEDQFGEIPKGVDYSANILQVLGQIQSESGAYFQTRQVLNRDIRNKTSFAEDIAADLPDDYDADDWADYDFQTGYGRLEQIRTENRKIQGAKNFVADNSNKLEAIKSKYNEQVLEHRQALAETKAQIQAEIKRLEAELSGAENHTELTITRVESARDMEIQQLENDLETSQVWADQEPTDTTDMEDELAHAEEMRKHLNEFRRMKSIQEEIKDLVEKSEDLTVKIEHARTLPAQILETATIPIEGLTVQDGVPLINGLPISNLSDGETLDLCVDIALGKPGGLGIILIDGVERLDEKSRLQLYARCKDKGLQMIASRTTDDDVLEVTVL